MAAEEPACPDETSLEALVQGRLPPALANPLAAHVESCERCAELAAELARGFADAARGRRERRPAGSPGASGTRRRGPLLVALGAGALLLLLVSVRLDREPQVTYTPAPGAQSSLRVRAFARSGEEIRELREKATLRAGDRVRLMVDSAAPGFLLVVVCGPRQEVRAFFPTRGHQSQAFGLERRGFLEGALEVGPEPGPERIFALFTTSPISVEAVREATGRGLSEDGGLRLLTRLPLPGAQQWTLLLEKP